MVEEPKNEGGARDRDPALEAELRRLKLEVLSRIAHDVRAPLSVVLTGLKELRETDPAFDDYQRSVFKLVCSSAEASLQLLKDLHDLARLEERCLPLHRGEVDLAALLRSVAGGAESRAGEKAARLVVELPDGPVPAPVDEARVGQIFSILLDAALRSSRGRALARLESEPEEVRLTVEDDGSGLPAEQIESVFEAGSQRSSRPGGTGLSLAVAKGLVEAHGGRIRAENVIGADGRVEGARFVVSLPR